MGGSGETQTALRAPAGLIQLVTRDVISPLTTNEQTAKRPKKFQGRAERDVEVGGRGARRVEGRVEVEMKEKERGGKREYC